MNRQRLLCILVWIAVIRGVCMAQGATAPTSQELAAQLARLYESSDYRAVHEQVQQTDLTRLSTADRAQCRYYDSLSLCHMEFYDRFRQAVDEHGLTTSTELSEAQRNNLEYHEAVSFHWEGRNAEAVTTLGEFIANHPDDPNLKQARYDRFEAMHELAVAEHLAAREADEAQSDASTREALRASRDQLTAVVDQGELYVTADQLEADERDATEWMTWDARLMLGQADQLAEEAQSWPAERRNHMEYRQASLKFHYALTDRIEASQDLFAYAKANPTSSYADLAAAEGGGLMIDEAGGLMKTARGSLVEHPDNDYLLSLIDEGKAIYQQLYDEAEGFLRDGRMELDETERGALLWQKYESMAALGLEADMSGTTDTAVLREHTYSTAWAKYKVYLPDQWRQTRDALLDAVNEFPDHPDVDYARHSASDVLFRHGLNVYFSMLGPEQRGIQAQVDELKAEGRGILEAFRDEYETLMDDPGFGISDIDKRAFTNNYWDVLFMLGEGDALWQEAADWPIESWTRLARARTIGLYHAHDWAAFREGAAEFLQSEAASDRHKGDMRMRVMLSYYYEQDWDGLKTYAEAMEKLMPVGSWDWSRAKLYQGIALAQRRDRDLAAAAAAFDAIISNLNEDYNTPIEHMPTLALYWRTYVAVAMDDEALARELATKIRDEMPDGMHKATAMKTFGSYLEE